MTPLLIAISDGDAARVEQLLSEGTDTSGNPLQTAALEGDEKIVNLLLKSGYFDIDARDSRERTAIYAVSSLLFGTQFSASQVLRVVCSLDLSLE
jgi:hypothetical protein